MPCRELGRSDPVARKIALVEAEVQLKFDSYALDMVSRAQVVSKLAQAGVPMTTALAAVGLDDGG